MPSSVGTQLKRSGTLIELTSVPSSNVESNWRKAFDYSNVVGYAIAEPTADAQLVIEQSIDGTEVDYSETITPTTSGSAQFFEIPVVGQRVRARLEVTGSPTKVRVITYMSTRASSITQT